MSDTTKHTPEAAAVTELILEVFRLNGALLAAGDRLTQPLGLTSARWQILGAIDLAGRPLSVAQISRRMGVSRQAVQRVANDLEKLGFIRFVDNPDHARAKLVVLTQKGLAAQSEVTAIQIAWSNELAQGLDPARLRDAVELLREIRTRNETAELVSIGKVDQSCS